MEHTSSPVDLDLLNDILRLPYRAALRDPAERVRHRAGRARRPSSTRSSTAPTRPSARPTRCSTILAEPEPQLARLATDSDTGARAARARARALRATSSSRRTPPARPPPSAAATSALGHRAAARLPAPAAAAHGRPRDLRRPGHAAAAPTSSPPHRTSGRLIKAQGTLADASRDAFPSLGDALERGRPALIRRAPADPGPRSGSARSSAPVSVNLDDAHEEPRQDRRGRADQRLALLRRPRHERLRLARPLPAHGARDQHLHGATRPFPRASRCTANFTSGAGAAAADAQPLQADLAREPKKGAKGGSVPPTGTLLRDLLGPPHRIRRWTASARRTCARSAGAPHRALQGLGAREPVLDYLLGGAQ